MEYIAVMDLGSSKMLALAADRNERRKIIASAQIGSGNAIRRGLIYNTDEATHKIVLLLQQLDRQLQQKSQPGLKKIYVGIGGQALHSQSCSFQKNVTKGEVDIDLIEELENEYTKVEDESYDLIEVVSREYFVDGQPDANPEGATGKVLEAKFQLIQGYAFSFKSKVEQAVRKAGFEVAGYFVSPLATAEATLTVPEKKTGCALVETGAGLTFISIYTNGLLRYLATLPISGNAITKDICTLKNSLSETEAENLKRTEGNALTDDDNTELNQWIEARATEIAANIHSQIQQSGYADALKAGIVLTGGTAALKNMDNLLAQQTKQTVRLAGGNLSQACALGMLLLGKENCSAPEPKSLDSSSPPESKKTKNIFSNFLFSNQDNPEDEQEQKKKEEEEKKKKQEDRKRKEEQKRKKEEEKNKQVSLIGKLTKNLFDEQ